MNLLGKVVWTRSTRCDEKRFEVPKQFQEEIGFKYTLEPRVIIDEFNTGDIAGKEHKRVVVKGIYTGRKRSVLLTRLAARAWKGYGPRYTITGNAPLIAFQKS